MKTIFLANKHVACTVQFWYLETWKAFQECWWHGVKFVWQWYYDSATTVCAKTFIIYITMIVTAPNAADVFGTSH